MYPRGPHRSHGDKGRGQGFGMSVSEQVLAAHEAPFLDGLAQSVDERTLEILARRRRTATVHRRGWLVRRVLLAADLSGLALALLATHRITSGSFLLRPLDYALLGSLPMWVILAKLYGLYDRDEERTDHT